MDKTITISILITDDDEGNSVQTLRSDSIPEIGELNMTIKAPIISNSDEKLTTATDIADAIKFGYQMALADYNYRVVVIKKANEADR